MVLSIKWAQGLLFQFSPVIDEFVSARSAVGLEDGEKRVRSRDGNIFVRKNEVRTGREWEG